MGQKSKKFLQHADGELIVEGQERKILANQNKTVDMILGKQVLSNYEQKTESAYAGYLDSLSNLDLQKHAADLGVFPKDNRAWNITKLKELFKQQLMSAEAQEMKPVVLNRKLTKAQQTALDSGKNDLV